MNPKLLEAITHLKDPFKSYQVALTSPHLVVKDPLHHMRIFEYQHPLANAFGIDCWEETIVISNPDRHDTPPPAHIKLALADNRGCLVMSIDKVTNDLSRQVLVYYRSPNGDWHLSDELSCPDTPTAPRYGCSIAITPDGRYVAVSAARHVYRFHYTHSGWAEEERWAYPDTSGEFGDAIAITDDGDTVAINDRHLSRIYVFPSDAFIDTGEPPVSSHLMFDRTQQYLAALTLDYTRSKGVAQLYMRAGKEWAPLFRLESLSNATTPLVELAFQMGYLYD